MKKLLSVVILLSCIMSSMFALSAKVGYSSSHRYVLVYDGEEIVLTYKRPLVSCFYKGNLRDLYAVSAVKDGATAEQIKEWKEFAKLFVEE